MELLSKEVFDLKISPKNDEYIHQFSKLSLDNLNLKSNKKFSRISFFQNRNCTDK